MVKVIATWLLAAVIALLWSAAHYLDGAPL